MSDSVWPTLVGGAISLLSTAATTFGIDYLRRTREARGTAYAIRGSIVGILTIVQIRQYITHVRNMIQDMEQGNAGSVMKGRVKQNYLEVYVKHIDKIGALAAPLPELISMFYTNVNSLVEDMQSAYDGDLDKVSQAQLLAHYKEFESLLTTTSDLGRHIIETITVNYPPPKPFFWRIPG